MWNTVTCSPFPYSDQSLIVSEADPFGVDREGSGLPTTISTGPHACRTLASRLSLDTFGGLVASGWPLAARPVKDSDRSERPAMAQYAHP